MQTKFLLSFSLYVSLMLVLLVILVSMSLSRINLLEQRMIEATSSKNSQSNDPSSQSLSGSTTTYISTSSYYGTTTAYPTSTRTTPPTRNTSTTEDSWLFSTTLGPAITEGPSVVNNDTSSFISYGFASGDRNLAKLDDLSFFVKLNRTYKFFRNSYNGLYISTNGLVSFFSSFTEHTPRALPIINAPLICPFWSDIDITKQGDVYYREIFDTQTLAGINNDINNLYGKSLNKSLNFLAKWAFVATWSEVVAHTTNFNPTRNSPQNTFQLVLTVDEKNNSYGIFNYLKLEWPNYLFSHQKFLAGYNGDNSIFYRNYYQTIEKIDYTKLINLSNVLKPGKWIYSFSDF